MPTPVTKRGCSSLIFNQNRSHMYTNCLNDLICEYNCLTYLPQHTRAINLIHPGDSTSSKKTLNKNSNKSCIKSSLSPCGQFLLTGSGDSNAYIYGIGINQELGEFRRRMPVIQLKGHEEEVTTVDWNPFDQGQVVTCSDDNTIRLWTVRKDLDQIDSNEFNSFKVDFFLTTTLIIR